MEQCAFFDASVFRPGSVPVPDQKETQPQDADGCAEEKGGGKPPARQNPEAQIGADDDTADEHGMDAEAGGAILGLNLPVLDLELKRLEQGVGKPQGQNPQNRREYLRRQGQHQTGSGGQAAKQKKGWPEPGKCSQ